MPTKRDLPLIIVAIIIWSVIICSQYYLLHKGGN